MLTDWKLMIQKITTAKSMTDLQSRIVGIVVVMIKVTMRATMCLWSRFQRKCRRDISFPTSILVSMNCMMKFGKGKTMSRETILLLKPGKLHILVVAFVKPLV